MTNKGNTAMQRKNLIPTATPATFKDTTTGKLYQFTHKGITPNGCWFISPCFTEILDIDIASGKYLLGLAYRFEIGTVQAY